MPAKRRWFCYNGTGDVTLPSSYIYSPATPNCRNGFTLCAIYAIYTNVGPSVITAKLQNYIGGVLSTGLAQPSGGIPTPALFALGGHCGG